METLLIKVSERKKADMLLELLKSMDFIESVNLMGDLKYANDLFDRINKDASITDLKDMTQTDINNEIKAYRSEKSPGSN